MEAWGVAKFAYSLLEAHAGNGNLENVKEFLESGKHLFAFAEELKACGWNVPVAVRQRCLDHLKTFIRVAEPLGIHTPKTHLLLHMIIRSAYFGNPWKYSTCLDESLNKTLKRTLFYCHQSALRRLRCCLLVGMCERCANRSNVLKPTHTQPHAHSIRR